MHADFIGPGLLLLFPPQQERDDARRLEIGAFVGGGEGFRLLLPFGNQAAPAVAVEQDRRHDELEEPVGGEVGLQFRNETGVPPRGGRLEGAAEAPAVPQPRKGVGADGEIRAQLRRPAAPAPVGGDRVCRDRAACFIQAHDRGEVGAVFFGEAHADCFQRRFESGIQQQHLQAVVDQAVLSEEGGELPVFAGELRNVGEADHHVFDLSVCGEERGSVDFHRPAGEIEQFFSRRPVAQRPFQQAVAGVAVRTVPKHAGALIVAEPAGQTLRAERPYLIKAPVRAQAPAVGVEDGHRRGQQVEQPALQRGLPEQLFRLLAPAPGDQVGGGRVVEQERHVAVAAAGFFHKIEADETVETAAGEQRLPVTGFDPLRQERGDAVAELRGNLHGVFDEDGPARFELLQHTVEGAVVVVGVERMHIVGDPLELLDDQLPFAAEDESALRPERVRKQFQ